MLDKPQHCAQNWLEMKPTEGGRICGRCEKTIVDFSGMSWAEIKRMQGANGNGLCGMYSERQLKYWGQEPPRNGCSKLVATAAMLAGLGVGVPVFGQSDSVDGAGRVYISGRICSQAANGEASVPVEFAVVTLKGTEAGCFGDEFGNYKLDVTDYADTLSQARLVVSGVGYAVGELVVEVPIRGSLEGRDVYLPSSAGELSVFYVTEPSWGERWRWRVRRGFGRG